MRKIRTKSVHFQRKKICTIRTFMKKTVQSKHKSLQSVHFFLQKIRTIRKKNLFLEKHQKKTSKLKDLISHLYYHSDSFLCVCSKG